MNLSYGVVIFTALVMLATSCGFGLYNHAWLKFADIVPGEVVELIKRNGRRRSTVYAPRVRYVYQGQVRWYTSAFASWPSLYRVGDQVPLAVNPEKQKVAIATFTYNYGLPLVGIIVSLASILTVILLANGAALMSWLHPQWGG